mmetsp:Transcript_16025/g.32661  ORF Transcript_16025/g.32661 Transcript_16025/m.32661 type:complete len:227 (+) Transcript_16025:911-1591(+)
MDGHASSSLLKELASRVDAQVAVVFVKPVLHGDESDVLDFLVRLRRPMGVVVMEAEVEGANGPRERISDTIAGHDRLDEVHKCRNSGAGVDGDFLAALGSASQAEAVVDRGAAGAEGIVHLGHVHVGHAHQGGERSHRDADGGAHGRDGGIHELSLGDGADFLGVGLNQGIGKGTCLEEQESCQLLGFHHHRSCDDTIFLDYLISCKLLLFNLMWNLAGKCEPLVL